MNIEVLTIFPEILSGFVDSSLIKRAQERGLVTITVQNIRDFASPPHFHVDDTPYGGGAGMVMKPEPLCSAIEAAKSKLPGAKVVLLTPHGKPFTQTHARDLSTTKNLILICGRYEGIDQRVIDLMVDEEISIGDYVVMGGEVPAMAVIEATVRLIDGVLGNSESLSVESFSNEGKGLLEAPQYTRPPDFRGKQVPNVLLSGNHAEIKRWQDEQSMKRTRERRPDLLKQTGS